MQSFRITEWSTIKFGGKGCAKSASQRGEKKFRWDGISKQARKSVKTKERKNFENERKQSEQAEKKCDPKEEGGGGRGAENEAQRESLPPSPLQKTPEFRKLNRSWWKENAGAKKKRRRVAWKTVPGFRGEAKKKAWRLVAIERRIRLETGQKVVSASYVGQ